MATRSEGGRGSTLASHTEARAQARWTIKIQSCFKCPRRGELLISQSALFLILCSRSITTRLPGRPPGALGAAPARPLATPHSVIARLGGLDKHFTSLGLICPVDNLYCQHELYSAHSRSLMTTSALPDTAFPFVFQNLDTKCPSILTPGCYQSPRRLPLSSEPSTRLFHSSQEQCPTHSCLQ